MSRIPYADLSKVADGVRKTVESAPINVGRMMAGASEAVFHAFSRFGSAYYNEVTLNRQLCEIAILRAGYIENSHYQPFHHEPLCRHLGMSEEQIEAIRQGDGGAPALTDVQRAVLAFCDDIIVNVRAGDATLNAVRAHLSDQEIIDLILFTGYYMMISRLVETTGVENDAKPMDWSNWSAQ